jgi:geranylgeranyl diphosphate synthase type II
MSLKSYRERFEKALPSLIEKMGEKGVLRDACEYALVSGGKRLRPAIVFMIAEALGNCDVMDAALSVECFHTASLIADDLPCMDDDALRRGIPTLHKTFGEGTAILASYTLIAAGYGGICENGKKLKENPKFALSSDQRSMACLELATRCAGLRGATLGQFFDLFPPLLSLERVQDIIYKKTVTLFEIAFFFGWLFGGGDIQSTELLRKAAYHLGMAFQIADDLEDTSQDKGKTIVLFLGKEKAISLFEEEIASLEVSLKTLNLWTAPFQELHETLARRRNLFFCGNFFEGGCL